MSFKSKFLNIITFGHVNRKAKKEAEKLANQKNEQLTLNTIEMPDVVGLTNSLGGSENIINLTNTISTITIQIVDFNKVNFEQLKSLSKRGVIKSKDTITLIVGDCAAKLKESLLNYKNK